MLTLERAKELNDAVVTEEHLRIHAMNVMASMGAMADHFGEDREHWMAVGYLHRRHEAVCCRNWTSRNRSGED